MSDEQLRDELITLLTAVTGALHLDGREDQRAFLVNVAGGAGIGGRLGIADVGLVRLGEHREAVADHQLYDALPHGSIRVHLSRE